MPPKRKSIITTRGQKRRQTSQEPRTPQEQGSDDSSAINELRQQVKQLMECQGQMMGMLNRSLTQAETTPNISQPMPPMLTVDPRVPEGLSVQPDVMAASRIVGTGTTIIPGEQHEQQLSLPPNLLFKKSNPIGTRVSQKVKDKTREGFLRKNIVAVSFFQNCAIHQYSLYMYISFPLNEIIQA